MHDEHRAAARARERRQRGFTLIELMTVIAIVAVVMTIAVVSINSTEGADTVDGYADMVATQLDLARQKAVATGRYQQIEVNADGIVHYQADTEGMGAPNQWEQVHVSWAPRGVHIHALDDEVATHISPGSVPAEGDGLTVPDNVIEFAPDGSVGISGAAVFIGSDDDETRTRVLVYGATGSVHAYDEW